MWDRRQVLASLTMISAISLPIRRVGTQPANTMPSMSGMVMTPQDCIESCWRSHAMCLETERLLPRDGRYSAR
jgi:hypothetical protein